MSGPAGQRRGNLIQLNTKTTSRQRQRNTIQRLHPKRQRETQKEQRQKAQRQRQRESPERPKFCDFAGTLKKAFSFWLSKAQNLRGLCNIQTEQIKGVAGLKMALFALICTRFLLQVIRRAFWRFQAGRIKGAKVRRVSVQIQTAGTTGTAGAKQL